MEYTLEKPQGMDDWEDELVVRLDDEEGMTKESPELVALFVEGHDEFFRPPERYRPGLFDVQIGVVSLAAQVLWDELNPTFGSVMIRNIQLERVNVERYSALDPSRIAEGQVVFRFEIEATYPQYRRAAVACPVHIVEGKPRRGLFFIDAKGNHHVLSKESMERYMGVKEWFTLSRPPDVELSLIDRVEHTDFPSYMRSRMTWDIGF